jgi:hypothetical protein
MSESNRAMRARNFRTVALLAALFLLPLLLSFWMYYGIGWQPAGRSNHGELFAPARPLPDASGLTGKWSLVYVGDGRCDEPCRRALHVMRQTRLALNKDMTRVNRVFLVARECCDHVFLEREHVGLTVVETPATALLNAFPNADRANALFVVDPLGNLVMRHDARANPKGLLEDLKKLLKLSHIG